MRNEIDTLYEQGMDVACIASRLSLTCEQVRIILGIEETEDE
tara:strand:- start:89 stop:214 length:126 start_codon:yes stop_codon:yes gene_type:complete